MNNAIFEYGPTRDEQGEMVTIGRIIPAVQPPCGFRRDPGRPRRRYWDRYGQSRETRTRPRNLKRPEEGLGKGLGK